MTQIWELYSMTANLVLRMTTTGIKVKVKVKVEFSLEQV